MLVLYKYISKVDIIILVHFNFIVVIHLDCKVFFLIIYSIEVFNIINTVIPNIFYCFYFQ